MFFSLATLATHGGIFSRLFLERHQIGTKTIPLIYGQDVWVHRPPVLGCRRVGANYERIQALSLGPLGAIDNQVYNDAAAFVGFALETRSGTTPAVPLPWQDLFAKGNCHGDLSPVQQSYGAIGSLDGLAVVLSSTTSADIPSFRVQQGKELLQINSVGSISFGRSSNIVSLNPVSVGDTVVIIANNSTGTVTSLLQDGSFTTDAAIVEGSIYVTGIRGFTATLPDVLFDLLSLGDGGLRGVGISPDYSAWFVELLQAKRFCIQNAYYFAGCVYEQSLQMFLAIAAPQSGLIPLRVGNQIAFVPKVPPNPSYLFNSSNASYFVLHAHPWDNHATNRLIIQHDLGLPDSTFAIDTAKVDGIVEESLSWRFVANTEQLQQNAQSYLESIQIAHQTIEMILVNPSFPIRAGDTIEAQHPQLHVQGGLSGYITNASAPAPAVGGQVQTIEISANASIAYGTVSPTSTANTLVDPSANFRLLVTVGDAIVVDQHYWLVAAVAETVLHFVPVTGEPTVMPKNKPYHILDLTLENFTASTWDNQIGGYGQGFTVEPRIERRATTQNQTLRVVYDVRGHSTALKVRDAINLSIAHYFWRIASVEPMRDSTDIKLFATRI